MRWTKTHADLALATTAQVGQKLAGYVVLMVLARHLTRERMGELFFAATVATLCALVTELGTNAHLTRATAEARQRAAGELADVLGLRLILMAVVFAALNLATLAIRPELAALMLLTSLYVFAGDLYYTFGAVFLGLQRVGTRMATALIGQVALVVLVLLAVGMGASLYTILLCYAGANLILVVAAGAAARHLVGPFRPRWETRRTLQLALASLPLFALVVLGLVHFKLDTVMLFLLATPADVATYEAGYKLLEVSRFLVRPAAMVFYPACAALAARGDWGGFGDTLQRLMVSAALLGVAGGLVVAAGAHPIVTLVWSRTYVATVPVVRVLFLSLPAVYTGFVAAFVAKALRLERRALCIMTGGIVVNLLLNLVAIPRWAAVGAAWTTLITETLVAASLLALIHLEARRRAAWGSPAVPGLPPRPEVVEEQIRVGEGSVP